MLLVHEEGRGPHPGECELEVVVAVVKVQYELAKVTPHPGHRLPEMFCQLLLTFDNIDSLQYLYPSFL